MYIIYTFHQSEVNIHRLKSIPIRLSSTCTIESVANVSLMGALFPNYLLSCKKPYEDVTNHKSSNHLVTTMFFSSITYVVYWNLSKLTKKRHIKTKGKKKVKQHINYISINWLLLLLLLLNLVFFILFYFISLPCCFITQQHISLLVGRKHNHA